ncbi:hypothetical protein FA15DRAFT_117777 [Coprinopsis marcescibilis]|uniref:Uncharacterized protein n=1 Tax=Coprinopsis marcescibilis TaxID=230819 RepID=A0A5C3L4A6_COPMA|nr:hypothetical protein FA15DRAFT_117777 [Coprinopsis marcescibilis]
MSHFYCEKTRRPLPPPPTSALAGNCNLCGMEELLTPLPSTPYRSERSIIYIFLVLI